MKPGFRLETDRLVLRPYVMEDLDAIAAILGDPETMRYYPAPFSREKSRAWIESNLARYRDDGHGLWAMELRDTGELVGNCGLVVQDVEGVDEVEVGWHVKRSLWRRGVATEAARVCCGYGFEELGLERIVSLIRPENERSRGVAEKLGMTVEREIDRSGMRHYVYVLERGSAG